MKMRQKLRRASIFLFASLLLAVSLLAATPPNTAYAWSEGRCINKYDPETGGAIRYWSQAEYEQLQDENCEAPEGPCVVIQTPQGYAVVDCVPKDQTDGQTLSRQKCIDKYDREFLPSEARVQQMRNNGCLQPTGPCRLANVQGIQIIDCAGHFENDFCKKYRGGEKDACIVGYIGGVPACEQMSGGEKDACEDGGENGLERDFDSDENDDDKTCESESGPLAWFGCPLLAMIDGAVGGLSSMIDSLLDIDESTYSNDGVVSAARGLRNVAFIVLVPMMMFMVIGTALNFGPFDPYTVKKALPRMFVATIFIALSLPLTTFLVELSNAVGSGLRGFLLTASGSPEGLTEMYSAGGGAIFTTALLAFGGGAVAVAALGTAGAMLGILWSFALVTLLALLIGFITLVLRELLIIVLIIMAPVAILVWIFPGNDKLWGLWKGTFTAMLLMYPLVALLITSGQVFGGVIGDTQNDFVAFFLKIIAYIMPFFFIPAVFRYGLGVFGNIAGIINDRSRGLFDRQRKKRQERYGFVGDKVGAYSTLKRKDIYDNLQKRGGDADNSWLQRRGARALSRVVGGYDIMAADSARQAAMSKVIQDIKNTGDDTEVRALTAYQYKNSDGTTGWKTLAGKEVDEASVKRAQARWGKDAYAQQAALSYEMTKASTEDQAQSIAKNYADVAKNQWGMSDGRLTGAWVGAAFENQNSKLEYKNMRATVDAETKKIDTVKGMAMKGSGYDTFVSEVYEKRGSYGMAQMGANTILELQEAYKEADRTLTGVDSSGNPASYDARDIAKARDRKEQIEAIAETFMHQYGSVGGDEDAVAQQLAQQQTTPGQREPARTANTPGAAHVAERVRQLATLTGVYGSAPTGNYTAPRGRGSSDNPRPQN